MIVFSLLTAMPLAAFADTSPAGIRAALIGQFLESIGCTNVAACAVFAQEMADDGEAASPVEAAPAFAAYTTAIPLSQSENAGDGLLQHLSSLFVLDSLFQNASGGLVTPGPVTLANIIVLYELFYAPQAP